MDTSLREVHAEGHLRRTLSTLKMLLRGHLPKEEFILTDRKMPSARFFLLGKGKICWEIGRFCVVCGRKPLRVGALCGAVVPRGGQGATPTPHFALTLTALSSSDNSVRARSFGEASGTQNYVVIRELVDDRWYEYFLHNQRGRLLEWMLLVRGKERIFTVSAPGNVRDKLSSDGPPPAVETRLAGSEVASRPSQRERELGATSFVLG